MKPRVAILYPLFFLSGAAGLGLQMVWLRLFSGGLGHEVPALLGVTGAFLGGMAAGGWGLSRRIGISPRPWRWYGGLELIIGVWSAATAWFIPSLNKALLAMAGANPSSLRQWSLVFALPWLALLPATAAMGATLAAMERSVASANPGARWVGAVYGLNTAGAVAGTIAGAFGLMPALGFRWSLLSLAFLNLTCGIIAFSASGGENAPASGRSPEAETPPTGEAPAFLRLGATLLGTGLLGIGFQLVALRVLSQVLENTLYTYASVLAVSLAGTAGGAFIYQRWGRCWPVGPTWPWLLVATGSSCLVGAVSSRGLHATYDGLRAWFGDEWGGVLVSEMAAAAIVVGLPALAMGALFSHLVQMSVRWPNGVGRATACNALGCALATIGIGVGLLPMVGTKGALLLIPTGYLLFLPRINLKICVSLLVPLGLAFFVPAGVRQLDLPPGGKATFFREGALCSVAVVRTPDGHRTLRVNNRLQMGGTAAALAERRQGHLPILLHPEAERALFLGPGTGITLGAAAAEAGLTIDGVELVPEVLLAMPEFEPENASPRLAPGIRLQAADARRYVRTTAERYDLIVADLFHPGQDGAGFLYTREHFAAVRQCLRPGGLFCQWLPLHQLDEDGLKIIVRTFLEQFPGSYAFLLHFNVDIPVLGLMGRAGEWRLAPDWMERRLSRPQTRERLREAGLDKPLQVLGCLAGDPDTLQTFAGAAPVATDDFPRILFQAPRSTARRHVQAHSLLLSFLQQQKKLDVHRFVRATLPDAAAGLAVNLGEFIAARDIYLQGLVKEGEGKLSEAVELYLESARTSLFFTPGYARCVSLVQFWANTDRPRALQLFRRLEAAQPAQPLAHRLLGPLFE